jgi:hypothetical protein
MCFFQDEARRVEPVAGRRLIRLTGAEVSGSSGKGLGKTQRSFAPILLPSHPETSSNERHVGPPPRNQ